MTEKRWISAAELTTEQSTSANTLAKAINVSPFLASLLVQRGVRNFEEAKDFFRPDLSSLHDPFAMEDMDKAVDRLTSAIGKGEKILVYGDYDVDGTTSVAMFYGFLSTIYDRLDYYIPDRYTEGYGVSTQGIDWAAENGFSLIVALDCGIKSVDKVEYANSLGVDFIICDHHRPGETLPPAAAVLDPKRSDCEYPYKELTGCGVGFKLLHAFCQQNGQDMDLLYPYLDLLVVSIASDIVPITGENRVLAYYGLQHLNTTPRAGLRALIKIAGIHNVLDIQNVVFGLGPRINAAGRIKHAKEAVRLLLCDDEDEADEFAQQINKHNSDRRKFDTSITDEALAMIQEDAWLSEAKSTVLFKEDWHKGVIGIVASRCIEHFHRPTIILTKSNGKAAGSARSVPGFDVYEAIEECADLLEQFGGHTFAAGMTLPVENVDAFRLRFDEIVSGRILPEQLTPMISVDLELDLEDVSWKAYKVLKQMGPFGPGNMTPVFVSRGVSIAGKPTIMKEKHIKFNVYQGNSPAFTVIAFGMAHIYPDLMNGKSFDICYSLDENTFRDKTTLQFMLKDIKF
ncbi:single-stranded-DNA-specific exonuclease RecJ [Persicitalea jodogahamensis]|uniref:Single-stranded-DNA-specific exonuclease RecJ n=1 Tax=Persicitalea jodogahamensis TaxID=402147 RepID=A0A8J3GBN6_9BACT|nr:single-stranded-DNA-specific exonuclease RecJ [Persicitalea jodogahamensis]GHB88047.1 single-stranded-DNA-specific exonuclease RecJ [Persicitalea jodogahamensis]